MVMPHDPNQPYSQPVQPQAYSGPMPPQPQVVYVRAPAPPRAKKGMSLFGHGTNWTLTILTCGMWIPMYGCWWVCVRSAQAWRNHQRRKNHRKAYS